VTAAVRPMTLDDLPDVYRLGTACYDRSAIPYAFWTLAEVADHFANSPDLCFVGDSGGAVVGFGLGAPSYEILEDTGHVEWIAVAPDHRGGGLARRLVEALVHGLDARGCRVVVADVAGANEPSRRLFTSTGFDESSTITFFTRRL
jgi:ribosomal protein S18 acetylase RimI-like enzyme